MKPEDEERRGAEARQILEHPIYREAYSAIQERIVGQLALADTPDETRKRLNDLLIALNKVRVYMEQVALSGAMATQEIERKRTLRDRIRAVV